MKATSANLKMTLVANSQELAQKPAQLFAGNTRKAIEANNPFCAAISQCALELHERLRRVLISREKALSACSAAWQSRTKIDLN